jgi:hypothetical protein
LNYGLMVAELRELRDRRERNVDSGGSTMMTRKTRNDADETVAKGLNPERSTLEKSHRSLTPTIDRGGAPRWLMAWFLVCVLIALAAAARRFIVLLLPSGSPMMSGLDATFASRTSLTLAHIIPATAFVLLAPFVLFRAIEKRWLERTLTFLGVVVGITAYAMSVDAFGGWTERTAVLFFNSLFLLSLGRASMYGQAGAVIPMRRWLTRAVGILLGIATTRPVMGVFFATSRLTHLRPNQFFGIAFWIGFSLNTIVVEMWLRAGDHGSIAMEVDRLSRMH